MKKILITGAGSYIGTSFEKYMKQWTDKYQVDTLDMIGDDWLKYDFSGYDSVYHVAGIAHSDNGKISKEKAKLYYDVNTRLTIRTAMKAKKAGVKQFIFMSSAIVYGDSAPIGKMKMITNDTPVSPANCYGDSKVKAEQGLKKLEDENFKVVILRPPMIYGKGSKGNYPLMSKLAQKMPAFPYVKNCRSMLYIENLMEFVRLMIENEESGIFFPQNAEYSNTSELVKMIAAQHGKRISLVRGCTLPLKIVGLTTGMVDKAFGNLAYEQSLSAYKENYHVANLYESIALTERKVKKRALILASVASMIEQFNMDNINILIEHGYNVDVACNFKEGSTISDARIKELIMQLKKMGIVVHHIPIPRRVTDIKNIVISEKQVKNLCNNNLYELVHCHSPIGGVVARLGACSSRKKGTKVIYTAHGFHFYKGAPLKNWIMFYPVEKLCSYLTDVLITINMEDYNFARKHMSAKRIEYIPGIGLDTAKFSSTVDRKSQRSKLLLGDNNVMLLSVGELNKNKNHEIIIRALSEIENTNIYYFIAGKGDKGHYLKELADMLGVHLSLLGYRTDITELLSAADIFVFSSFREGLSVSLMEAMASGLPCVVSKIRGNVDLIDDSKGGYLCKPNSVRDFEIALKSLIGCRKHQIEYGNYNKIKIKDFDINKVIDKLSIIYFG